jgi:RNA polymerase sigma-70 factor (ECF subfamily)
LLGRAQAGDTQAFVDLYERHRRAVYRVAYGLTHDLEDAMDVVQETFIKAHKSIGRFERRAGVGTWLCQIAVHQSIDMCRKRKVRHAEPLEGVREVAGRERGPESHAREHELSEAVGKALMKLSDKHRAVFVLHVVKGMPYKEIAETLGCSLGTVMSRLFYARRHLQGLLAPYSR